MKHMFQQGGKTRNKVSKKAVGCLITCTKNKTKQKKIKARKKICNVKHMKEYEILGRSPGKASLGGKFLWRLEGHKRGRAL